MSDLKIAYAVTTYNGVRLVETVHSIPKGSRLLVVDNSIKEKSLASCWNYAVERLIFHEGYDFIIICNDDIILHPRTGEWLLHGMSKGQFEEARQEKDRLLLLVSAYNIRDVERGTPQSPPKFGPDDLADFEPRWGLGPDYSCFCVGRQLFEQVGKFDEEFPVYFEDNDSHYRIRGCGYEAMSYAPYYHYGSGTTNSSQEMQQFVAAKYEKSKERYAQKWGGLPGDEKFTTAFKLGGF